MLENPSSDSAATASIATVKRYAPPNQRNRSLGRRKSGDRLERVNNYVNDGERNPVGSSKSGGAADYGDFGYINRANEKSRVKLIPLYGCCNSEASQLLNNRWTAAVNAHHSLPEDSAERPVIYTRKNASPWGQVILPHLQVQPTGEASTGSQRDFLSELREAMGNADCGSYI